MPGEKHGSGTSTTTTLCLGDMKKVIAPGGTYTCKRYLTAGVLVEQTYDKRHTRTGETTRYLLYDHLGSLDVITDAAGTVEQDLSFDAWGQRRSPDKWTVLALLRLQDTGHGRYTTRGFTGHEMLDAVGIVHMNGRIYDPTLGRFLQADPVVQFPNYSQNWNRYSYVLNNPLNATDPTGYFLSILGGIFGGAIGYIACGYGCAVVGAAIGAGLGATADVLIRGGNFGQALLAGVSAAALTYAGGSLFPGMGAPFGEVLLYGLQMDVIGGITTTLQGGNFGHGFVVAGTAALVGGALGSSGWFRGLDPGGQLVTSMVAGGTVSRITGGKFANGAMTAAFAFLASKAANAVAGMGMVGEEGEWIFPEGGSTDMNDYDTVMTNGIMGDRDKFVSLVNQTKYPGYFNPSRGPVADLLETLGQRLFARYDALASGFARGLAGVDHPMTIIAHSQGTLTASNAARYFGLPAGSTFTLKSPALPRYRAHYAVRIVNGGELNYGQPWFDAANLWAPSLNPLRFLSGFGDILCGFCVHRANGLP